MDRLTNEYGYCEKTACNVRTICKCYERRIYDKLKEYEDLEEQGLLLRLPKNGLSTLRTEIKNSILHYLCDDWNNHKRGRAHKENQAIYDRKEGYAIWNGIDLEMVMEKVVKGIWSVDIEKILTRTEAEQALERMEKENG